HEDVLAGRDRHLEVLGMKMGRRCDVDGVNLRVEQGFGALVDAGVGCGNGFLRGGDLVVVDVAERGDAGVGVLDEVLADARPAAAGAGQARVDGGVGGRAAHGLGLYDGPAGGGETGGLGEIAAGRGIRFHDGQIVPRVTCGVE